MKIEYEYYTRTTQLLIAPIKDGSHNCFQQKNSLPHYMFITTFALCRMVIVNHAWVLSYQCYYLQGSAIRLFAILSHVKMSIPLIFIITTVDFYELYVCTVYTFKLFGTFVHIVWKNCMNVMILFFNDDILL